MENKTIQEASYPRIKLTRVLLWGCTLTTLVFWTTFEDPFNPLKLSFILLTASWLIGYITTFRKDLFSIREIRNLTYIVICMLLAFLLAAGRTDFKRTAIFGENQRSNGLLMYLGLSIILVSSALVFNLKNSVKIFQTSSVLGLVIGVYGLLQLNGIDIVKWNNPYNAIISTVGNPNFAAAIMAIMASLVFGSIFNVTFSKLFRIFSLFTFLILAAAIYLSNARQGLIGILIGIAPILIVWIHTKNKYFGFTTFILTAVGLIFAILGMLQIGPLTNLLYKGSVTVRGYYWRAGIEMFQAHPWFGIGIDRYGAYFKQYREVGYPLNYGFDISSSNAHNVLIQIFATGGIFLGTFYLALLGYIFWRGIIGIRAKQGADRLVITAIFSAWLSYQATSFVSIDSPGIAVWGWLLGGAVVGMSTKNEESISKIQIDIRSSRSSISFTRPVISIIFAVFIAIISTFLYKGETSMFRTRAIYNPAVAANAPYLKESAINTISTPFISPIYKITSASYLTNSGFIDLGLVELQKVYNSDKRNDDALDLLATYNFQLGKVDIAIGYREKIIPLNPWNAKNYLLLGLYYKYNNNFDNMKKMQEKIISFASSTPIGEQAKAELVS